MQGKLCDQKTCSRGYILRTHGDFSNICFYKEKKVFKKYASQEARIRKKILIYLIEVNLKFI